MRIPLRSEIQERRLLVVRKTTFKLLSDTVTCVLCRRDAPADGGSEDARTEWVIGLTGRIERCFCPVGTDAAEAERLFALVVKYTVSPCTLRDVIEDQRHA